MESDNPDDPLGLPRHLGSQLDQDQHDPDDLPDPDTPRHPDLNHQLDEEHAAERVRGKT